MFHLHPRAHHLDAAGKLLSQNAERHLKSDREMRAVFADCRKQLKTHRAWPKAHVFTGKSRVRISRISGAGRSHDDSFLRTIVWFGAQQRYAAISAKVSDSLKKNLP